MTICSSILELLQTNGQIPHMLTKLHEREDRKRLANVCLEQAKKKLSKPYIEFLTSHMST